MAARRSVPWGTVVAVLVVVVFAGGILGYYLVQNHAKSAQEAAVAQFVPSESNKDPSTKIPGVVVKPLTVRAHVTPTQRVAYVESPPFGGPHDGFWAACQGNVYPKAVRNENMVHSLEHGAVWIAYHPEKISGPALERLKGYVENKGYTMMSPYPGLDSPISLQSWGHQLKLSDPNDPRIGQFIASLRQNPYTTPEQGASCDALGPGAFDPDNPPRFDPTPPGPNAVPPSGAGAAGNSGNGSSAVVPTSPKPQG